MKSKALSLAAIAILAFGIHYSIDVAFHPWAYAWTHGGHTLIGEWTGSVSTPKGESLLVHLNLEHSADEDHPPIEGTASVCAGNKITDDLLRGKPGWWGSAPMLRISAPMGSHGSPQDLHCHWSGDTLNCQIDFSRNYGEQAERVVAKAGIVHKWPPVAIQFQRSTRGAFEVACKAATQR